MRRIAMFITLTMMSYLVFAQQKQDSTMTRMEKKHHRGGMHSKKMMQDLNLSEDQKKQLKEMKLAGKEKKEAILKDSKLTEEQKKEQLKKLHKQRAKDMQSVLTEEQKAKMKALREKRRAEKKENRFRGERHTGVDSTKQ
jgi:periplasmic protein CpxP/Spy